MNSPSSCLDCSNGVEDNKFEKMNTTRIHYLLENYLHNTCSESEMQELFGLLKRAENEPAVKQFLNDYWKEIPDGENRRLILPEDNEKWFREIQSQAVSREGIPAGEKFNSNNRSKSSLLSYNHKYSQWIKVAAILIISIFLSLFYFTVTEKEAIEEVAYTVKTPGAGEKIRFTLSDGTQVHLNSESKMEYPVTFGEENREVRLEGEAYFVVARDEERPFRVRTGNLTTKVLGTSFNVRSYQDGRDIQVAVSTGTVALYNSNLHDDEHQVILKANQWASYTGESRSFTTGSGDVAVLTAWNEGVLLYHDKALSEVASHLERWYGVSISFESDEIKDCIIRGEHRDETLVNVLEAITYAFDITYHIEGRKVMLAGKGC